MSTERPPITTATQKTTVQKVPDFSTTPTPQEGVDHESQVIAPQDLAIFIPAPDAATAAHKLADFSFKQPPSAPLESGLPALPPPARLGRPRALTAESMDQLCLLLSVGFSRQAAAYLAIPPSTVSSAIARDEYFAATVKRAEELALLQPLLTLFGESKKNWRAAAWLIEHKRKYPAPLDDHEKAERDRQRLADIRRDLAFQNQVRTIHDEARQADTARRLKRGY